MGYEVRELRAEDLDEITRVIDLCDDDDSSPARRDLQDYLREGGLCRAQGNFVALAGGRPVGIVGYAVDRFDEPGVDVYWGTWFYVHPEHHGRGVGRVLYLHTIEALRRLGCRKLYANVSSDPVYDAARRFYARAGFVLEHAHPDYFGPGEHSEIYAVRLDPHRRPAPPEDCPPAPPAVLQARDPVRVREARPTYRPALVELFRPYGAMQAVRADAYVWRHFARPEPSHRLYVAASRRAGLVGVAALEPAEEEEVDTEVFWVPLLGTHPAYREAAVPVLLGHIEARQRRRGGRRLYASLPGVPAFAELAAELERAGFEREGALPDYYADGIERVFFCKALSEPPPAAPQPAAGADPSS
ncbi:MAG: hypothetical protein KatS3mg102_2367 [Planctomycetota bacterium]|nr:MAG: hypothetical protein KatS3mg102_2367 [Planctomycetota bacterium]